MSKLILFSSELRYHSKDVLTRSLQTGVQAVEFSPETTVVSLGVKLDEKSHIAIMYHSHDHESNILFPKNDVDGTWYDSEFITLLETVKDSGAMIDLLSCNLTDPAFKDEMNRLSTVYGVTIRYSLDETGNTPNGDWILESHNVDAKAIYFTETISEFDETLLFLTYGRKEMFPFNLDVNGEFAHHHRDYDGNVIDNVYTKDGNLIQFPPSSIYSDVTGYDTTITNAVALVHNGSAGCALLDDGTIHVWGDSSKGGSLTSDQLTVCNNIVSLYPAVYGFVAKRQDGSFVMWGNNMFYDSSGNSEQLVSEYATKLNGSSIKMAISANHSNNVYWGFFFLKSNGTLVECLLSVSPPNSAPNNTIPDDIYNEGFFPPDDYQTALEDESDPIVHVESRNNSAMAVLKESGSLYLWGKSVSGKKQFRQGVKSIKRNISSMAWIYNDGTMELRNVSVSKVNENLSLQNDGVGLQEGEKFVSIDASAGGFVAYTNMNRFVTLGDTRIYYGFNSMNESNRQSFNSILQSEGINQMYAGDGYVIFLTNNNNVYSYGANNKIRSAVGLNIQYVVPIIYGRSGGDRHNLKHVMVDSDGIAYVLNHRQYGETKSVSFFNPKIGLQGFARTLAKSSHNHMYEIYGIYSDGSVLNLQRESDNQIKDSTLSTLQDSVYIYTNFLNTNRFALINSDQSIQRGIEYTKNVILTDGGEQQTFGGLTVSEIEAKLPILTGKSVSNGLIDLSNDTFDQELVTQQDFDTETDMRDRIRQAVITLKQRAVAVGLTLGSSNRLRVSRTSLSFPSVFSKPFFQIADNNVEVNHTDLNGDGIYASIENSGDYLKINTQTPESYVTITNAGDGTYTLTIDGNETLGVIEGTTGTHDGFRYHVGSASGEPIVGENSEPICFLKGTEIPMADGSSKPVESIVEGDVVKTMDGQGGDVIAIRKWVFSADNEESHPYLVEGSLSVSGKHMVVKEGKYYRASDIGVKQNPTGDSIEYFHFQTKRWINDFVPFGENWGAEVWDGKDLDVSPLEREVVWLQNHKDGSCHKFVKVLASQ